jgi:F-type H+-transporting ATPase subunit epsilon
LAQPVDEVALPGLLGEFGVLPGHVALLAATKAGVLSYRSGSERGRVAISAGFAEVDGQGGVVALAQRAVRANKIDRAAAEKLRDESQAQLNKGEAGSKLRRVEEQRAWAQALLDALST